MPTDLPPLPAVLCKPFLVEFDSLADRLRAFGGEVRDAFRDHAPESLPSDERVAQQQFLECLDAMSWRHQSDAHAAARALFDRLFWSWRSEDLRIVEIDFMPFSLDLAWSANTVRLFADVWKELAPVLPKLREPFDVALSNGELVGSFAGFLKYAQAWGDILTRGAEGGLGLIVVQFESNP